MPDMHNMAQLRSRRCAWVSHAPPITRSRSRAHTPAHLARWKPNCRTKPWKLLQAAVSRLTLVHTPFSGFLSRNVNWSFISVKSARVHFIFMLCHVFSTPDGRAVNPGSHGTEGHTTVNFITTN